MSHHVFEGTLDGRGLRIAIVVARFNEFITRPLLDGALSTLQDRGVEEADLSVTWVPGAYEIPGTGSILLARPDVDAAIGIGCVIRGDTAHFEYVAGAAAEGILEVGLRAAKPFVFGVLTVNTVEQARERSGNGPDNKGAEAALTALEMAQLYRQVRGDLGP